MDSIRFLFSFLRLADAVHNDQAKAVVRMLKSIYPDQKFTKSLDDVVKDLTHALFKGGVQGGDDVLQELLRYVTEKDHDWGTDDINVAYRFFMDALRKRAISETIKIKKREKKVVPEPEEEEPGFDMEDLTGALDDKAAIKQFLELLESHMPGFEKRLQKLYPDQAALFDIIFNDEVGTFVPDITQNMSQSAALKEKYPEIYQRNTKRWYNFVGELRKKLLDSLESWIFGEAPAEMRESMRNMFFD